MPGVFLFTWDNCQFGERYRHRQVLVTNLPCLAALAKDCPGNHTHLTIGFGKDLQTSDVSAYAVGWCKEYAQLFARFIRAPVEDRCVHCLPQGDSMCVYERREALRRCSQVIGLDSLVDSFDLGVRESNGETYFAVKMKPVATVEAVLSAKTHLGARCEGATLPFSFSPEIGFRQVYGMFMKKGSDETFGNILPRNLPHQEAEEVKRLAALVNWPESVRTYVPGRSVCAGVTGNEKGVRMQNDEE